MENVIQTSHINLGNGTQIVLKIVNEGCSRCMTYVIRVEAGQIITPLFESPDREKVDAVFEAVRLAYNAMALL